MKAVTYRGVGQVAIEDVPEPKIQQPGDAIVRITRCAICGSDLHIYHGHIPGMVPGFVCGHEFTGVVEEVGAGVQAFRKGDRVVGTFHTACGHCAMCRKGAFNQCQEYSVFGYGVAFGNLPGSQAEFVRVPHADVNLRRIPKEIGDEQALFCGDILTTAYGAVRNAHLQPGETVAVIGCGPVGLMAIQSAFAQGAARVLAIDLVRDRAELAERLGAVPIVASETNPVAQVNKLTGGLGADVVIEAVGGPKTVALAFELVRGGGRISAVGVTTAESFPFPLATSLTRDISFRIGLANIHRDIDATLALVAGGRIDPEIIISHRLPLTEAVEGYRLFDSREATKVVLIPGE